MTLTLNSDQPDPHCLVCHGEGRLRIGEVELPCLQCFPPKVTVGPDGTKHIELSARFRAGGPGSRSPSLVLESEPTDEPVTAPVQSPPPQQQVPSGQMSDQQFLQAVVEGKISNLRELPHPLEELLRVIRTIGDWQNLVFIGTRTGGVGVLVIGAEATGSMSQAQMNFMMDIGKQTVFNQVMRGGQQVPFMPPPEGNA